MDKIAALTEVECVFTYIVCLYKLYIYSISSWEQACVILVIFLISTDMKVVPNLSPIALGCGDSLSVTAFFFEMHGTASGWLATSTESMEKESMVQVCKHTWTHSPEWLLPSGGISLIRPGLESSHHGTKTGTLDQDSAHKRLYYTGRNLRTVLWHSGLMKFLWRTENITFWSLSVTIHPFRNACTVTCSFKSPMNKLLHLHSFSIETKDAGNLLCWWMKGPVSRWLH